MNIEKYNNEVYSLVEEDVSALVVGMNSVVDLDYPLGDDLESIINAPSKHIRAVLTFLYLKALGLEVSAAQIKYQEVIELLHNASLIHDDIVDESDVRRGEKTISSLYDSKLGVLSGDYLLSLALKKVYEIGEIKLVEVLSNTFEKMCNGEIAQYFNRFKVISIEEYLDKSFEKTGSLFSAALVGGIVISGKGDTSCASELAENFGIAFQIRDDLDNVLSVDSNKPVENDVKNGIFTAPMIYSSQGDGFDLGVEKTKLLLNNYIDKTKSVLREIPDNKYKLGIVKLVELLGE